MVPKDSRLVVFGSYGGRYPGGNSKLVFEYLRQLPNSPLKCYFLSQTPANEPGHVALRPMTLRTFFLYLRAKTQVTTHTAADMGILRPSRRKYRIHLWHGHSGPKADGWVSKKFSVNDRMNLERDAKFITKFLVTSRINLYYWAYALILRPYQLMPLGFPRNDILLSKNQIASRLPKMLNYEEKYDHVILYAPTYKKWAEKTFFPFDDFDEQQLEDWLERNRVLLLLRHHINQEADVSETRNIRDLSSDICPDVNQILPEVDILVTGYSSIASDFLLMNKPIVYVVSDRYEFEKREGFVFGNYDFWTPGPKVDSFKLFIEEAQKFISGEDKYSEKRETVNQLINEYQSDNSTEKVARYLIEFITKGEDTTTRYSINFMG